MKQKLKGLFQGSGWAIALVLFQGLNGCIPSPPVATAPSSENSAGSIPEDWSPYLSYGEDLILLDSTNSRKAAGIDAFRRGNFRKAERLFLKALETAETKDPETLIYLNNARVMQRGDTVAIAVAISVVEGESTDFTQEILRGVAQAQKDFLDRGNRLLVLIANDLGTPETSAALAQTLVYQGEILGVVGHTRSDQSLAAGKIYQEQQLPMISATSTSTSLSDLGDYIFRTVPNDRLAAEALISYTIDGRNIDKIAIVYNPQSNYSSSLKESVREVLLEKGESVSLKLEVGQGTFNASQALMRIQQSGAEAIALLTDTSTLDDSLALIRANAQAQTDRLPLLGGDVFYQVDLLDNGAAAQGMILAVSWHPLNNPAALFPVSSRELWGQEVHWRSALAYDATRAFIQALQETPNYNRQAIQAILASPQFVTVGAADLVRFSPDGDRPSSLTIVTITPGDRSGYGYDFVPLQIQDKPSANPDK